MAKLDDLIESIGNVGNRPDLNLLKDQLRHEVNALRTVIRRMDWVTCVECPQSEGCPYAYDPYNTQGDCLAAK